MITSQVTIFSFTCFTLYQKTITHEPRRRHPSSTSKMVVSHSFCLLPISVNKQYLSNIQEPCLRALRHHQISPPKEDNQSKYITAKENYEKFSRALRGHLVKYTTILSSKAPTLNVKPVTHIHFENVFELIIKVVFNMIPQLGGL